MCITASILANLSGTEVKRVYKACASSSLCPSTGNQTFSADLGFSSSTASAFCCNTDNCNTQTLPFPTIQPSNDLMCFICEANTSKCLSTVQCSGQETNCFSANVTNQSTTHALQGCVTPNIKRDAQSLFDLVFLNTTGTITGGMSICNTPGCNRSPFVPTITTSSTMSSNANLAGESAQSATSDAASVRMGMLHLLLGLVIFFV
ncbi:phospholipase A2 inhibitor and Ly6/PLAUR domain-containing protein [Austrofundulus limnaeus]|uniref:Phospholipase A2 inhibitor and Ly6/PLAUR domain-containing protein n=1 Tax=Austrofundulus limnaeus TaxID=52670 RepID=A0A2I4AVK3_AUSLI|nr:PREDICTED: phospholipase A2 inhibitor and Ly6/PLAUR domain-containing protein [Austrofundulus limnaeus]